MPSATKKRLDSLGIRVTRNKLYVYVASGALAAVSAIVLTSRLRSGLPSWCGLRTQRHSPSFWEAPA